MDPLEDAIADDEEEEEEDSDYYDTALDLYMEKRRERDA